MNSLNMVELLKAGLEDEVKKVVTERLVREQLKAYEKELRGIIKPVVESVSFKGIESIKDHMRLREELHVYLHWDDEQQTQVTRKV